jgi:intracellular sulfur oxidation DsrE/DsrF family protein
MPKFFRHLTLMALMSMSLVSASFAGDAKAPSVAKANRVAIAHRVAIQVDQNDPAVMNLALNNATNVVEYYRAKGENVDVDIVANGPGLHMLRVDTSPVQDRIKHLKGLAFSGKIQFSACNNTKEGMQKKEGQTVALLPEASIVPSGVVRLMQLQEQGWSYVRP